MKEEHPFYPPFVVRAALALSALASRLRRNPLFHPSSFIVHPFEMPHLLRLAG
jgi:hypothetical protein